MTRAQEKSKWLFRYNETISPRIRLFAFPFAGGGTGAFRGLSKDISSTVEVVALHYPGRETRLQEEPLQTMEELVANICNAVIPFTEHPFAFLGISMGGVVAFEAALELNRRTGKWPEKFFVAAGKSPVYRSKNPLHRMDDERLIETVSGYGGIPDAVLQNREMMRLVLPVFRADFAVYETYRYNGEDRLALPVFAYHGKNDRFVSRSDMELWEHVTTGPFANREFEGGHFFVNENPVQFLRQLEYDLFA